MKLSEAIIEGVKKDGFQTFSSLFKWQDGKVVGCCALGAAAIGLNLTLPEPKESQEGVYRELQELYPKHYYEMNFECPIPTCKNKDNLIWGVVHLNDRHEMTRENIALVIDALGY